MKFQFALLFSLLFLVSGALTAQEMTKDEKKKWKGIAKTYKKDLSSLRTLVEERDEFQLEAQQAQQQLTDFRNSQTQGANRAMQMEQEVTRLNQELLMTREAMQNLEMENQRLKANTMGNTAAPNPSTASGIVFRVQVGAFTKGKIPQNIQNMTDMMVEDAGRVQKVLVGNYWDIANARARVQEVKRQGAPDAFIVAYRDGMRISVEEALKR